MANHIKTVSLPAGKACPGARDCRARVEIVNGKRKVIDGPETEFRCFSASQEAQYPTVFAARAHNMEAVKGKTRAQIARIIQTSIDGKGPMKIGKGNAKLGESPDKRETFRWHVSGDFFTQAYFDAFIDVVRRNPERKFYAYTKSLHFWVKRLALEKTPKAWRPKNVSGIPGVPNLVLTASVGGKFDHLIDEYSLRSARVVYSECEASALGLEIDHDDSHAMNPGPSFALLIHGTQPPKSAASAALVQLKKAGNHGYSRDRVAV